MVLDAEHGVSFKKMLPVPDFSECTDLGVEAGIPFISLVELIRRCFHFFFRTYNAE